MTDSQVATFRRVFVIVLITGISLLFGTMIWPFLKPLFLAAILSGFLYPVYRSLRKLFRGNKAAASVTTILLLMVLIMGPLSAFIGLVAKQAVDISSRGIPWFRGRIESGSLSEYRDKLYAKLPPFIQEQLPEQGELLDMLGGTIQTIGNFLLNSASQLTAGAAGFFLAVFVMLYAMFYFLMEGPRILDRILYLMPLKPDEEQRMLDRFLSVTRATLKGTLIIAVVQGLLGGIGFAIVGIQGAAFWGTIMGILSLIPVVGTPLVWIPGAIVLLINGQIWSGIFLLVWGGAIVSSVDNILRPILVGQDTKMPDLLILIGTLGGLYVFGALGILVGPIVCGLFLTGLEIYAATFQQALPATHGGDSPLADETESRDKDPGKPEAECTGDSKPLAGDAGSHGLP